MSIPDNLCRRPRSGPSKLVTELRLYRSLYEDWNFRLQQTKPGLRFNLSSKTGAVNDRNDSDKQGVSLRAIREYTNASLRTLHRYLRELEECGAIQRAAFRDGNLYCRADFPDAPKPLTNESPSATAHLLKLSRTMLLMKKWLDKNDLPALFNQHFYTGAFFKSLDDAKLWYMEVFPYPVTTRTIQRDAQAVREALYYFKEE